MTQHCHETVKKELIWATEAWPQGGRFRNCSPRQEPPIALTLHCSSPIHITPCPTATLCSHLLLSPPSRQPQPTPAAGGDASCMFLGIQSLLLPQPWLLLQDPDRNYSYGPASHPPLPSCCTVTEITWQIWAAKASLLQSVTEMEGENSDCHYDFDLHPFWLMVFPLQPLVLLSRHCAGSWHGNINISLS